MAQRRMFSKSVLGRDDFISLPSDAAKLYLYLNVYADDDGFLQAPNGIVRFAGVGADSLGVLEDAGFVLRFPSGAVVIRHWHQQNYLRRDTYAPTVCREEYAQLAVDENGVYSLKTADDARNAQDASGARETENRTLSPESSSGENSPADAEELSVNVPSTQVREEQKSKEQESKEQSSTGKRSEAEFSPAGVQGSSQGKKTSQGKETSRGKKTSQGEETSREETADGASSPLPSENASPASYPCLAEVREFAAAAAAPDTAEDFYAYWICRGWRTTRGETLTDWKGMYRYMLSTRFFEKRRASSSACTPVSPPPESFSSDYFSGILAKI